MLCKGRKSNRLAKFQEKNLLRGAKALSGKKNPDSKLPNVKAKKDTPNTTSMVYRIFFIEYLKKRIPILSQLRIPCYILKKSNI